MAGDGKLSKGNPVERIKANSCANCQANSRKSEIMGNSLEIAVQCNRA